jgi:hypothetical protein
MSNSEEEKRPVGVTAVSGTAEIFWDASKMASFHADVVNVQSTRERVDLLFGTNETLQLGDAKAEGPVRVELNSRIILTPHATKRLLLALTEIMKKYESRFGELSI